MCEQLRAMGASGKDDNCHSDIYGTQSDILLQDGLVNLLDDQVKKIQRQIFLECLILSARKDLGIEEKRFYNNSLEVKHKLKKENQSEERGY